MELKRKFSGLLLLLFFPSAPFCNEWTALARAILKENPEPQLEYWLDFIEEAIENPPVKVVYGERFVPGKGFVEDTESPPNYWTCSETSVFRTRTFKKATASRRSCRTCEETNRVSEQVHSIYEYKNLRIEEWPCEDGSNLHDWIPNCRYEIYQKKEKFIDFWILPECTTLGISGLEWIRVSKGETEYRYFDYGGKFSFSRKK